MKSSIIIFILLLL